MIREKWKRKQREIRLRADLIIKDKRPLVSLAKMQGNVLYLLSDGGMIKDCGPSIHRRFLRRWQEKAERVG